MVWCSDCWDSGLIELPYGIEFLDSGISACRCHAIPVDYEIFCERQMYVRGRERFKGDREDACP